MSEKSNQKKTVWHIVLSAIILLQLVRIIYGFVFLKEDFHSDEIWSFGLSNSYYEPFVFQNADHTEYINYKQWFSSDVMKNYLTVDKNQRFSYGSVYYNQVHDYHPPFYYFILHTICSFFPGEFSPWFGFVINIFSFIGTIFFLYKLMLELSKSEKVALVGCLFYGFSMGAFNTFEFVRIYALATMLSTMYLYYHAKLYHSDNIKKETIIIFIITLIGCLTHHFFIPFAGCISVCFCVYYLIKKKFKKFWGYSFTMLAAVVASVAIFPATIDHLFSGRIDDNKYPFSWQFKLTLSCMTNELFGINIPVVSKYSFTANLIAVTVILVIISPLVFLFRKEVWFKSVFSVMKEKVKNALITINNVDLMIVSMLVSTVGIILLTALTVSYIHMGATTDRYVFIAFPGMAAAFVIIVSCIKKIIKKEIIADLLLVVVCSSVCLASNIFGPNNYLFTKDDGATSLSDMIEGADCVFISDDFWLMTCFSRLSMNSDYLYAITGEDLRKDIEEISDSPASENSLYYYVDEGSLFIDYDTDSMLWPDRGMSKDQSQKITKSQLEKILCQKYGMCECVGFDNVFERNFLIYKVI